MTEEIKDLKEKLKTEVEKTDWAPLKQHHDKGAVFIVSGIDLLDAAVAVAQDRVEFIKLWLESGALAKPTDEQIGSWEENPNLELANFIIIQPYVLVQIL